MGVGEGCVGRGGGGGGLVSLVPMRQGVLYIICEVLCMGKYKKKYHLGSHFISSDECVR